jgi:hypothetical protein
VNRTGDGLLFTLVGRDSVSHTSEIKRHTTWGILMCDLIEGDKDIPDCYFHRYMPDSFSMQGWNMEHITYLVHNYLAGISIASEHDSICITDSAKLVQFLYDHNDKALISLDRRHCFLIRVKKNRLSEWKEKYGDR